MQLSQFFRSSPAARDSVAPLILRVALGAMLFPHGAQKLLGWFGGYGFTGSMGFLTGQVGAPWIVGLLVILGEFFGSLLLLVGLGTRFAAASVAIIMAGATIQHQANGFFMNWAGNQKGEGLEFFLLAIGIAFSLIALGGGKWSLDSRLTRDHA
ncbi:MAG: DoxX family protein [Opitutaceae bacterium]